MNYKMMGRFVGKILMVEAVFMAPAMLISLWEKEYESVLGFFWSIVATAAIAGLLLSHIHITEPTTQTPNALSRKCL